MITGLLGWFARKPANKRQYPRKRKAYMASYLLEGDVKRPAIGLDVSAGGLSFLSQKRIPVPEFDMEIHLEGRTIRVRVAVVREEPTLHRGQRAFRYGMQFSGIAADDWDAIVRYTTDQPVVEPRSIAAEEIQRIQMSPDDMARLIPLRLQNRLLARLVKLGRLAPLDEKITPLVQYFYSGLQRYENAMLHRLTVQSKLVGRDDVPAFYETTFLFDDSGKNIKIVAGGPIEREAASGGRR